MDEVSSLSGGKGHAPPIRRLTRLIRAGEWWEYKLVPAAAVFYATVVRAGMPLHTQLIPFLTLIAALAVGGAFASVINDLTDREVDCAAGKALRPVHWSQLATLLALGAAFAWLFSHRVELIVIYGLGWLAFAAYSVPPLRLKVQPIPGVLCDAVGAHLVPALLAVAIATPNGLVLRDPWLWAVAAWSLACGLRGIISHQLADEPFDRRAGVGSFVTRYGAWWVSRQVRLRLFPIELAALTAMLFLIGSPAPLFALGAALLFLVGKIARFELKPMLVEPVERPAPVLGDYYEVFLPCSLLAVATWREPADLAILALHLVLFHRRISTVLTDMQRLPREQFQ